MICADTSSVVALLKGEQGRDVEVVRNALIDGTLVLAPASVAELLSDPGITPPIEESVLDIPQLEVTSGYWERVGRLRARLMRDRFRPKLADSLIAQSCLDHHVLLVTRDRDFSPFQKLTGLRLVAHDTLQ
jgi:predicted nucleic acid-binding protein